MKRLLLLLIACVTFAIFASACAMEGPGDVDDSELAPGEPEPADVGVNQEALGPTVYYYTINSNNGASINSNPNRVLKNVRMWAMSQHAGGSNKWSCSMSGGEGYCQGNVAWTSGTNRLKLHACDPMFEVASNGGYVWRCTLAWHMVGDPNPWANVGFVKWNSAASVDTANFYFNDGGQGESNFTHQRFAYRSP